MTTADILAAIAGVVVGAPLGWLAVRWLMR